MSNKKAIRLEVEGERVSVSVSADQWITFVQGQDILVLDPESAKEAAEFILEVNQDNRGE